jgi:hypothetical protein
MNDELPVLDEALINQAQCLATGADIHQLNGMIGTYRNSVDGAHRLTRLIADGKGWLADDQGPSAQEDLVSRIRMARDYEVKLRVFVTTHRLASIP